MPRLASGALKTGGLKRLKASARNCIFQRSVNLKSLNVAETDVTDAAVPILLAMPKLTDVQVYRSKMTKAGVEKLKAKNSLWVLD